MSHTEAQSSRRKKDEEFRIDANPVNMQKFMAHNDRDKGSLTQRHRAHGEKKMKNSGLMQIRTTCRNSGHTMTGTKAVSHRGTELAEEEY